LHFIGTWRNRYRKRFSNSLGAKSSKGNKDHSGKKKTIIHIDMDCFFVSVVIRNRPELHDKPVAVCHSDNPKGTAEISSANYPARNYGALFYWESQLELKILWWTHLNIFDVRFCWFQG